MKHGLIICSVLTATVFFSVSASAQMSTPPATEADKEALYTAAIEYRTADIIKALNLTDADKSNAVHDTIIAQYRVMRARDALIDAQLKAEGKAVNYATRAGRLQDESRLLHQYFLAKLAELLTPDQIETVKDRMTYNKVQVTYNAYLAIVPGLTDADKAKIMEMLKLAREEAIDGGSANEKSNIFQMYKNQINDYLDAHGHDVAKAYKDWETRQVSVKSVAGAADSNTNSPPK